MSLETVSGRKKVPVGGAIHWQRHSTGCSIGYRRTAETLGTWWARYREPGTGKLSYERLGDYASLTPSKQFSEAVKDATKWFRGHQLGMTHDGTVRTVSDACQAYVNTAIADGRDRKASDAESRFKRYVFDDPIGRVKLSALKPAQLKTWRERLIDRPALVSRNPKKKKTRPRSLATVNRDMSSLRAALNAALEDGLIETDLAWRKHLKPIPEAGRRRDIYLTIDERRALLDAADEEVRPFLRGLMLLPFRPGALAGLTVGNLDKRTGVLIVGKDKAGRERRIGLPTETADFFREQAKGKLPAAPLVAQRNGTHWDKDAWKKPIKSAVLKAGIRPDATAYALRHSTITDLCAATGNSLLVAQISGTSVAMIEKHYGHLLSTHAAAALEALKL